MLKVCIESINLYWFHNDASEKNKSLNDYSPNLLSNNIVNISRYIILYHLTSFSWSEFLSKLLISKIKKNEWWRLVDETMEI